MRTRSDMALLMTAMLPPLVWFACFSFLYSAATLACGPGLLAGIERYLSLGLAAAVIVGLGVAASLRIESRPFLTTVSRGLSALAIVAVLWLIFPLLLLQSCDAGNESSDVVTARLQDAM